MVTRSIVHWECQAPEHRTLRSRHGNGGLTIHDGSWAYCDGAGSDDGHHWAPTGGVPLESLVRWAAPNGHDAPPTLKTTHTNGEPASAVKRPTGVRRT